MFDEVLRIETNWPSKTVKNVDGFATLLPNNEKPEETSFTQAVPLDETHYDAVGGLI